MGRVHGARGLCTAQRKRSHGKYTMTECKKCCQPCLYLPHFHNACCQDRLGSSPRYRQDAKPPGPSAMQAMATEAKLPSVPSWRNGQSQEAGRTRHWSAGAHKPVSCHSKIIVSPSKRPKGSARAQRSAAWDRCPGRLETAPRAAAPLGEPRLETAS